MTAHWATLQAQRQSFLFAGQQYDAKAHGPSAGLYYMRARFYDPAIGRFINADPLEGTPSAPQSLNRYAYALNNPANLIDPTGLDSEGSGGIRAACATFIVGAILLLLTPGVGVPLGWALGYNFAVGLFIGFQLIPAIQHADITGEAVASLDLAAALRNPILPAAVLASIPSLLYDVVNCVRGLR